MCLTAAQAHSLSSVRRRGVPAQALGQEASAGNCSAIGRLPVVLIVHSATLAQCALNKGLMAVGSVSGCFASADSR